MKAVAGPRNVAVSCASSCRVENVALLLAGPVTCVHVSEDGSLIATGGSDGKVVVWQSAEA